MKFCLCTNLFGKLFSLSTRLCLQLVCSDLYSKKFPELEQLVPNPIDYIRTVRAVGNETVRVLFAFFLLGLFVDSCAGSYQQRRAA